MEWITTSQDADVRTITLDRPDKLNAFFGTMREELLEALEAASEDEEARVVLITGSGRTFCAGGDIDSMQNLQRKKDVEGFRNLLRAGGSIVRRIRSMRKPVIAAVNGVAAGAGCNLAVACDMRIASEKAKFAESFVKIGVHPDWGGTWLLPRLIGPSQAMEMMMTGRLVEAEEALRIGLVDRVVAPEELMDEATSLAVSIASGPPIPIADIKAAIHAAESNTLEDQLELEEENQVRAFLSEDSAEGMKAFREKRKALFTGR